MEKPSEHWLKAARETADAIVRDVCELPDRTSPDDQPDMLLVTVEELHAIILSRLGVE